MRMILAVVTRVSKTPVFSQSSTTPQKIPKFSSSIVRCLPPLKLLPQSRKPVAVGQRIPTATFFLIFYLRTPVEYCHPWRRSLSLAGPPRPRRPIPLLHFHLRSLMTIYLGVKKTWTYLTDTRCNRTSCCRTHRWYFIHTVCARPRRMTYRRTDHPEDFPSITGMKHQISSTVWSSHSHDVDARSFLQLCAQVPRPYRNSTPVEAGFNKGLH